MVIYICQITPYSYSKQTGGTGDDMDAMTKDREKNGKKGLFHLSITQFCIAAVFMGLTCIATMLIQIPIPLGYAHLGDSVILISAYFFGPLVGALAGGIGSALADLLTGFPIWALPTLLIKTLMPLIACGFFSHKKTGSNIFSVSVLLGAVVTLLFMAAGYVVFGAFLYGGWAAGAASAPGLLLKAFVNLAVFLFLGTGLSKAFNRQKRAK